jgi:hypothetical protein
MNWIVNGGYRLAGDRLRIEVWARDAAYREQMAQAALVCLVAPCVFALDILHKLPGKPCWTLFGQKTSDRP